MSDPNEEHNDGYTAQPTVERVDLEWPTAQEDPWPEQDPWPELEDDDPEELERLAEDLKAAVTGDYPETMADDPSPEPEPERYLTVPVRMTYEVAAALLARERGTDQLDVYDAPMVLAVLVEVAQRAIQNDLSVLSAQEQWTAHLARLADQAGAMVPAPPTRLQGFAS